MYFQYSEDLITVLRSVIQGAQLGIEPRTSPTLRENYTTKPLSHIISGWTSASLRHFRLVFLGLSVRRSS
ncbi:hypothetical protein BC936DRAFT_142164 [Jimgerdemannia flammicorona]|uniref:Uncharacterized protein n=2 Tax=Jimgerdemannia flammicorona TaxID=994334 RepID=A0A433A0U3_9FUNG|nr:hypothetical protein BC936DRAFT_142164 [Jimgerdemannia flammicorona]RUS26665.1 hypothetical protein BC938DRAFT_484292 [Jimgerdemannia flammicorona]